MRYHIFLQGAFIFPKGEMTKIKENREQGKNIVSVWNIVGEKMFIDSLIKCLES